MVQGSRMKQPGIILLTIVAAASARPGFLTAPLTLAQVGPDGRVLDTPEVAVAKAEHAAAHANERLKLANEAIRTGEVQTVQGSILAPVLTRGTLLVPGAPIGPDGRVQDTAEVTVARANHAVAHINERINLANEAVRTGGGAELLIAGNNVVASLAPTVGPDGRILDTPEVAAAKANHAAAQINERINLANEATRSGGLVAVAGHALPLVSTNGILASLVPAAPIGPDGRVQDTSEVALAKAAHAAAHINEKVNLANEAVKSADVVAVAGPAVAYGRLVY
ncbi:hypothetical protein KM043_012691 [Ampulex compressa]|nr:hypothetical protein KM043_012691 [Ampulex compressa]